MSRYVDIEGDWVDDAIKAYSLGYYEDDEYAIPIERFDSAPSIDIVRCKECKWLRYCETEDLDLYLDCDNPDGGGIPRSEEWFCADGERKESE